MTARKTIRPSIEKRFVDSLTDEQRALLQQSREKAERERPAIISQARQAAEVTAAVDAEIGRAFEALKGLRLLQKVSLAEMSERTGIAKRDLTALEQVSGPGIALHTLVQYARALGKELRISLGDAPAAAVKPQPRKTVASAR